MPFVRDHFGNDVFQEEDDFIKQFSGKGTTTLEKFVVGSVIVAWLTAVVAGITAWVFHVVACIKASAWFLLIVGIIVPPIGWVHGFGVWFGWLS